MNKKSVYIKLVLFIVPVLFLAGCSTWGNFTTYFNRYYNTKVLFEKAEAQILAQKKDLFDTEELLVPGIATQSLTNVIKDASKILQFNSDTKYVDDALMILGKSFYYQGNYQKALRKFEELISTQNESDLILEAKLWIAKTELKLKMESQSLSSFATLIQDAITESESEIIQDAYIEVISYYIKQEDYNSAIKSVNDFLKVSEDEDINSRVLYELGKLYNYNNDYVNAENTFLKAIDLSSDYKIIYHSKIELAKSYRNNNKLTEAFSLLDEMNSEDKNAENFAEIELEKGLTYLKQNNVEEAEDILVKVDTTYPNTLFSAIAKYKLGEINEKEFRNFEKAKMYYQRTGFSTLPIELKDNNSKKVSIFNNYFKLVDGINLFKRQIDYINDPDEFLKDSLVYYKQKEIERERLLSANNLPTNTNINIPNNVIKNNQNNTNIQPELTDKEKNKFNKDPKLNANKTTNTTSSVNLNKVVTPPIRPTVSADSLKELILNYQFELGTLFATEFNLPDSVYKYFNYILTNFPNSRFQTQSLFALGNYYLTTGDTLKADSLFLDIYTNHKSERIVNSAALILNKPIIDFDYDPAKELYNKAEEKLEKGDYNIAIKEFLDIYKNNTESDYAPKALYAIGWTLENNLSNPDSAASIFNKITREYPRSVYANALVDKVSIYNQEMKRLNTLKEAELKAKLNKEKEALLKDKETKNIIKNDSSSLPLFSTFDDKFKIERNNLVDSLKKRGITLPDSIIQKILLLRNQVKPKPKAKDSLKTKEQILLEK